MLHLVLDSSIYRHKPRLDSPEFKLLSMIAASGDVVLHVPYIVEREFITHLQQEQAKKVQSAISNLSKASEFEPHGPATEALVLACNQLVQHADQIVAERGAAFLAWLEGNNAQRHELDIDQTNAAWEAYFGGLPPLKQAKVRDDIPDSFIFQQVLALHNQLATAFGIVVNDEALRAACADAGIQCWSTLHDFIVAPVAQAALAQAVIGAHRAEVVEFVLNKLETEYLDDVLDSLESELLSGAYSEINGDSIPGEFNQIHVSLFDKPYDAEITDLEYLGGTIFVANIRAKAELTYEFSVFKNDAFALDEDKHYIVPESGNEHYVDVETTDTFSFVGRVELQFPDAVFASSSVDDVKAALEHPALTASDLDEFELVTKAPEVDG